MDSAMCVLNQNFFAIFDKLYYEKESMQMKIGKISQAVLERSVLRQIRKERDDVIIGAGVGVGASVINFEQENAASFSARSVYIMNDLDLPGALFHVINKLACAGSEPSGVLLSITLPEDAKEQELKDLMKHAQSLCERLSVQILGGHTQVSKEARHMLVTITGIGKISNWKCRMPKGVHANQDIIITKWVGMEGTSRLARIGREQLLKRLPHHMIDAASDYFQRDGSVISECSLALKNGAAGLFALSEGGVFGGLWEFGIANQVGLELDLRKIPLCQETVEICECFQISPYELMATGSLLICADNGHLLVQKLEEAGIHAALIGRTTNGHDRTLLNMEERRYLEPTKMDSYYQALLHLEERNMKC